MFSWLIQICDALAYAHEEGFVHRDIKPGNILVDHAGCVKVADFGLVKAEERTAMKSMDTVMMMGTPDFSSPEIADYHEKGDQRSDIYSVGILTYQLFTRKLPKGLWEPPSNTLPSLDHRVDRVVDFALHSNKEKRYQTIAQMGEELKRIAPDGVTHESSAVSNTGSAIDYKGLHQNYFSDLSAISYQRLTEASSEYLVKEGEMIVEKGYRHEKLLFLIEGKLNVFGNDDTKIEVDPNP